jgi:UDP-N-acetyl-alpha-D-muramoyl-L-alanyl-L-glutamate epimerase
MCCVGIDLSTVGALRFSGRTFDPSTGVATFSYSLSDELRFTETVTFTMPAGWVEDPAFERVLDLLYVAISTSYYKIAAPKKVVLDPLKLADKALPWVTALFREGLGEFAYRNDLPHVLDLDLVPGAIPVAVGPSSNLGERPLVPVGGGKDSIVTVEALKSRSPVLFAVNPNAIITSVMAVSDLPILTAKRVLDPQIRELNAAGGLNGHIPVTAINSLIAVATSLLHGLGPVVMSNESSASVPNLSWRGHDINHQWSKGLPAEILLRDALEAHAGLSDAYFSLLRGMSELHIASVFARYTAYDHVVTSCNAAFKQRDASARWCGHCPKCRFVFLAMAPFTGKPRLLDIFGGDLFEDQTQLRGYRELMGIAAHKPFECVGEIEESQVALRLLTEHPDWADSMAVRTLAAEVPALPSDDDVERTFRGDGPSVVPAAYGDVLRG